MVDARALDHLLGALHQALERAVRAPLPGLPGWLHGDERTLALDALIEGLRRQAVGGVQEREHAAPGLRVHALGDELAAVGAIDARRRAGLVAIPGAVGP